MVVDPRAGHGPGIGGFKEDSEIGNALAVGHPVYFVTFFPDPVPGQRLVDVMRAEAEFLLLVRERHPRATGASLRDRQLSGGVGHHGAGGAAA